MIDELLFWAGLVALVVTVLGVVFPMMLSGDMSREEDQWPDPAEPHDHIR